MCLRGGIPGEAFCENRLDEHILVIKKKHYDDAVYMDTAISRSSRESAEQGSQCVGDVVMLLMSFVMVACDHPHLCHAASAHRLCQTCLYCPPYLPPIDSSRKKKKLRRKFRSSASFLLLCCKKKLENGEVISVSSQWCLHLMRFFKLTWCRKFEHSKTFGLVTSSSSNAVWTKDEIVTGTERRTGAGRAIVGANEEVLCWDVKKGELLGRWRDADCKAQVTVISQSKADEDVFAVGYVFSSPFTNW